MNSCSQKLWFARVIVLLGYLIGICGVLASLCTLVLSLGYEWRPLTVLVVSIVSLFVLYITESVIIAKQDSFNKAFRVNPDDIVAFREVIDEVPGTWFTEESYIDQVELSSLIFFRRGLVALEDKEAINVEIYEIYGTDLQVAIKFGALKI